MKSLSRLLTVVLLVFFALARPAAAQDSAVRLSQLEEQMRQLLGQVETLNLEIQKLQRANQDYQFRLEQLEAGAPGQQAGAAVAPAPVPVAPVAPVAPAAPEAAPAPAPAPVPLVAGGSGVIAEPAPGPKILGTLAVPPGTPGAQPVAPDNGLLPEPVEAAGLDGTPIAPVPSAATTPDALYQQSYEALLRSQFGPAQQGFQDFIKRYPQHELAGNATYWLGESLYAQSNYKDAAQTFLDGFKAYPNGPKAPDTLLKLGLSLNQLGQKPQACTVLKSVNVRFPKAVEARKRAQAEARRAGCSA